MDCAGLERWLDEGMPGPGTSRSEAEEHAGSCRRCADAAKAARFLESALMEPAAKAPAGFADRVMSRVRAGARFSGADAPFRAASAMPWWIRALSDPAGAIPITLGILFLIIAGRPQVFAGILAPLLRATSILLVSLPEWSGAGLASPLASLPVQAGFALGILPIVLLASSPLFRWSEALFSRKRP